MRNYLKHFLWLAGVSLPLLISAPAVAQVADIAGNKPAESVTPPPTVWNLTPAAEPVPALRYRLWPDRTSMVPGNAMVPVNRAIAMMLESNRRTELSKQYNDNYERWLDVPLEQLPREEVRKYLDHHANVLNELHRMTPMRESEYNLGIESLRGTEIIELLLPEFQNARQLARLLQLESRLALSEGRFDDALRSMQTGVRLGESISGAGDLLIIKLVGIAITGVTLVEVEAASARPGTPNLYWALATVPESTYAMRPAIEFESQFVSRVFPQLANLPEESLNESAWRSRLTESLEDLMVLSSSSNASDQPSDQARLLAGLSVLALAEKSRIQLIDEGLDPGDVKKMSPSEVVVRATSREFVRIQDAYAKWLYLPDALKTPFAKRAEEATFNNQGMPEDLASVIAGLLLPAIRAADSAGRRIEQTIAKLVTAQALRDYAATHGELPPSLADLTDLPAWPDPLTGEPFGYTRTSPNEAILKSAPAYDGDLTAEITLRLIEQ